jgi:hypothetical protein
LRSSDLWGENRDQGGQTTASSRSVATQSQAAESKAGWDAEAEPSTPQWPGENGSDRAPSGSGAQPNGSLDLQGRQSPRVVPTGILPAGGLPQPPQRQDPRDAFDDFEIQTPKSNSSFNSGRSLSNVGAAAKPSVQWLPGEPQPAAKKSDASADSSASSRDPWPLRIEARRTPQPLFAPDDFSVTDKKPPVSKQESFDAGTNWSDLPAWQGAPGQRSLPPGSDSGPTIHPGSF